MINQDQCYAIHPPQSAPASPSCVSTASFKNNPFPMRKATAGMTTQRPIPAGQTLRKWDPSSTRVCLPQTVTLLPTLLFCENRISKSVRQMKLLNKAKGKEKKNLFCTGHWHRQCSNVASHLSTY